MTLTAGEIQRLHSTFGAVDDVLDRRRALYRLTLELACERWGTTAPDGLLDAEVVDSPAVRAHLGDVLGGIADLDLQVVRPLDEPVVASVADGTALRLAAGTDAPRALHGALSRLGADLGRPGFATRTDALVLAGSDRFGAVEKVVTEGVELARRIAPELVDDLIPHCALLAVLDATAAGPLGSASVREYPGLVLLPEPRIPLEVAEAIVHEGAHQKFFDLAMTGDILGTPPDDRFTPPWSDGAAAWPFEQCVAAFHAYCCLAAFAGGVPDDVERHDYSLLPKAHERATVIGNWLGRYGSHLGVDGQAFVGGLRRRAFTVAPCASDVGRALAESAHSVERIARRQCGDRILVIQLTRPALVLWMPNAPTDVA